MFTGIIEELGSVRQISKNADGARIDIACARVLEGARIGDSTAVNGVCLTLVEINDGVFSADVSEETLKRTTLGSLTPGSRINLERPLTPSARLGGHIVQGHVDGVGELFAIERSGEGFTLSIGFPENLGRYVVEKGSITVDGISLTVASLGAGAGEQVFTVAIIPHTWSATNLSSLSPGAGVNLEVDIIAKYVERMMAYEDKRSDPDDKGGTLTIERLKALGY